jgi:hypothetical protein
MKIIDEILSKNVYIWLPSYIKGVLKPKSNSNSSIKDVIFAIADHFEPFWENNYDVIDFWEKRYPRFADNHYDSDGSPAQHSWFFPIELYDPVVVERLCNLCRRGYGEIEIHLHHQDDTEERFRNLVRKGVETLSGHGALKPYGNKFKPRFGFIHGNWALNNSRKDARYCGVNDELRILKEEGCYADFTLPSAPSDTQTAKINSIYYAKSNSRSPKGHDSGIDVKVGRKAWGDLMIIQGPLTLNWWRRKNGLWPRIENSEISGDNPGTKERIKLWEKTNIHVHGRPEWIFIKVHCHGGYREGIEALLGEKAETMHYHLECMFRDNPSYRLHYVTARECYNIIKAAEDGKSGNPANFKDYNIPPPENRVILNALPYRKRY